MIQYSWLAMNMKNLKDMLIELEEQSKQIGLKMNVSKTKVILKENPEIYVLETTRNMYIWYNIE